MKITNSIIKVIFPRNSEKDSPHNQVLRRVRVLLPDESFCPTHEYCCKCGAICQVFCLRYPQLYNCNKLSQNPLLCEFYVTKCRYLSNSTDIT